MGVIPFDNNIRRQVRKVIDYANLNVYQLDDILDMMNAQLTVPGELSEHLVVIPIGRWVCYYLVDHPQYGPCHYFQIKPDASGKLPDKEAMEYIVKEFGIDSPLLDKHITIDEINAETKIIIPFVL